MPTLARLGYSATMISSGKSTAAEATAEVANFSPLARSLEKTTYAFLLRMADDSKKGVRIEDLHRYPPKHEIFDFLVNSFRKGGHQGAANLKDQKKVVVYAIGNTPVIFTTNKAQMLDDDVRRRTILLPMLRAKPSVYATDEERGAALSPIREAFEAAAEHQEAVQAHLAEPMPSWLDAQQRHRWLALYAVCRAFLGEEWCARLDQAARHLEGVTATASTMEQLLRDVLEVRQGSPNSGGILPATLYDKLRAINPELWGDLTDTRLGRELRGVQDADGRPLERVNAPAGIEIVGERVRGSKYFPWAHFEATWAAHGITQAQPDYKAAA